MYRWHKPKREGPWDSLLNPLLIKHFLCDSSNAHLQTWNVSQIVSSDSFWPGSIADEDAFTNRQCAIVPNQQEVKKGIHNSTDTQQRQAWNVIWEKVCQSDLFELSLTCSWWRSDKRRSAGRKSQSHTAWTFHTHPCIQLYNKTFTGIRSRIQYCIPQKLKEINGCIYLRFKCKLVIILFCWKFFV